MAKIVGCHKNSHDNQVKKVSCRLNLVVINTRPCLTTKLYLFPIEYKNIDYIENIDAYMGLEYLYFLYL